MDELFQPMTRGAFLGRVCALFAAVALPGSDALASADPHSLEHPEPRNGITGERVLSGDALASVKSGRALDGYEAAKTYPAIFDGIACGCGCTGRNGPHRSLLVCYETMQPTGCHACQEEADLVARLAKKDTPLSDIRMAVDKKFG